MYKSIICLFSFYYKMYEMVEQGRELTMAEMYT